MGTNLTQLEYDLSQKNWFVFVVFFFLIYNFRLSFTIRAALRRVYTGDFCRGNSMQFLSHQVSNMLETPAISRQQITLRIARQGGITCAHVRDLMARAAANGLGTIINLEKMEIFPSTKRAMASSNRLRRPWRVSPARVRLINSEQAHSLGFACAPKNNRMDENKIQICPA